MFKKPQLPSVEPVKLKPFCSMRPGVYIVLIFAFLLILGAFSLFVLPGLLSDTAYVTFNERVKGSGVYEDGKYLGNGNDGVYRTNGGNHTYIFTYEGIEYGRKEVELKKKVFFSLFSHSPVVIEPERTYSDQFKDALRDSFIRDISIYSAVLEHDESFNIPPIFSSFASNAAECGMTDVRDIWLLGASHVTGKELYEDYLKGKEILMDNNILFSSSALEKIEGYMPSLSGGESVTITQDESNLDFAPYRSDSSFSYYRGREVAIGRTIDVNALEVKEAPLAVYVPSFAIAKNMVTEEEWAKFVEENPMWSPNNKEELINKGLVDDNYLKGITLNKYIHTIRPIRNISFHAAQAYVEWISAKEGVEYFIPTEAQWTAAAESAKDKDYVTSLIFVENNSDSPTAMMGQLWEFTSTPFVPLSRLSDYTDIIRMSSDFGYDDIIVKGGSYITDPDKVDIQTVGIASRSQCSEFCGLRLAKNE